jgi:hypothetical protein
MIIEKYLKELTSVLKRGNIKKPIFRGQIDVFNENGALLPVTSSAARRLKNTINNGKSKDMLKQSRFIEYHNDIIEKARNSGYDSSENGQRELYDLEVLAQIQHYGGATCLVDFTKNFFTALWFATNTNSKNKSVTDSKTNNPSNGRIYIIDIEQDTKIFGFVTPEIIRKKNIEQILKIEIFGDEYKTSPQFRQRFWIWEPKKLNNRIYSQDSVFFFGLSKFENRLGEVQLFYDIEIQEKDKKLIQQELSDYFNINASTIYSDLQGFSGEANNSREKASFLLEPKDCLITSINMIKKKELDIANNYLNQASGCFKKENSECPRNVSGCSKLKMTEKEYLSKISFQKARCNEGDQSNLYKTLAFYREAFALDNTNYKACYELMRINYDLKNYSAATKYAEKIIDWDKNILFDLIELNLIQSIQVDFDKYIKLVKKDRKLLKGMGTLLIDLFVLINNVVNKSADFCYSESLNSLMSIECQSYEPYWLFEDLKDWLTTYLRNAETLEKKTRIHNLLLIIERIEDKQKELVNQVYEIDEF